MKIGGGGEIWDLEEVCIGEYQGKPLYQTTFNVNSSTPLNAWTVVKNLSALNIDKAVSLYGMQRRTVSPYYSMPLNFGDACRFGVQLQNNQKVLICNPTNTNNANVPCTVRLTYTKTTDTG